MFANRSLSRRDFLRMSALGASFTLAACAPKVIRETVIVEKPVEKLVEKEVTKIVKETVIIAGTPKVVEKVVRETVVVKEEVEKVVKETVVVEKGRDIFQGKLAVWHGWGNSHGGGLAMIDLTERFMELHPNVQVINVYDATGDKVMAAFASGAVPDTLVRGAAQIPTLAQRGGLMDLTPFVERDNWDLSQYFDVAVEQCSWKGRLYAMTHHPDIRVFYRAKDIFRDVGLDPEKEPQSWDDIMDWGMQMSKQEDGSYVRLGYVASWTANPWPTQFIVGNGGELLSEDGHRAVFNSEQAIEAMNWALKAVDDICGGRDNVVEFQEVHATAEGTRFIWMFPRDLIGMALYGNWMCHQISVVNEKLDFDVGMFPGGPSAANERFVFGGGTMMVIPNGAKQWELAWEWLKFLGSEEGGWLVQKRTGDISGRIDSAKDPKVLREHLKRKEMVDLFEKANRLHYVKSPISQQFDAEMNRMADRILLKELPVKEAVATAASEVQRALDEFWATA